MKDLLHEELTACSEVCISFFPQDIQLFRCCDSICMSESFFMIWTRLYCDYGG